jgi:hypothetical protein
MERLTTNIVQYQIRKFVTNVIVVAPVMPLVMKVVYVIQEKKFVTQGIRFSCISLAKSSRY